MISFKQFLQELLNSEIDSEVRAKADTYKASAIIAGRKIVFDAVNEGEYWAVQFIEKNERGITHKQTGSGGELQVFSFILQCLQDVVARYAPASLKFDSDDSSRTAVYRRLIKRVGGNYELDVRHRAGVDYFTLTKK